MTVLPGILIVCGPTLGISVFILRSIASSRTRTSESSELVLVLLDAGDKICDTYSFDNPVMNITNFRKKECKVSCMIYK